MAGRWVGRCHWHGEALVFGNVDTGNMVGSQQGRCLKMGGKVFLLYQGSSVGDRSWSDVCDGMS
jgi:hypothetical protein